MSPLTNQEFPPLLAPGFHPMTLADVSVFCVTGFPSSTTRAAVMMGLEKVVQKLQAARITGTLWIDGSFLTEKIEPNDVDLVLSVPSNITENPTPAQMQSLL